MRGIMVERRIVDFLRGMGATIWQSEELDHLKIDFVFIGNQTGELRRIDLEEEAVAVQITTAPTHFKKFENFVKNAGSLKFPYRRKLYIAIGKAGAPTQQLLQLIYAILLSKRYNREDEISNSGKVACVIFADCTYQLVGERDYQQVVEVNMTDINNSVAVNDVPVGTVLPGKVYIPSKGSAPNQNTLSKGYVFVRSGEKRFFAHRNEQDEEVWSEIARRFHARRPFNISFSVLEYTDEHPAQKIKVLQVLD